MTCVPLPTLVCICFSQCRVLSWCLQVEAADFAACYVVNTRCQYLLQEEAEAEGQESFALPEGVAPFLEDRQLYSDTTAAGIALLWAPKPFHQR